MMVPAVIDRPSTRTRCSIDLPWLGKYRQTMALLRTWNIIDRNRGRKVMRDIEIAVERSFP